MSDLLSSAWNLFNDESSFVPLYASLSLFASSYAVSRYRRFPFHKWLALHNTHNAGAVLLGSLSLIFQNDRQFSERITIFWSLGYFVVDLWDCLLRWDVQYSIHAVACLSLGVANYASPVLRQLRMNSKAAMCELSTPVLHVAKTTRRPAHFALFGLAFTLCRIVWVPIMAIQLHRQGGLPWSDVRILGVAAFYCLNLYWYYKIIRILVTGGKDESATKDD
jgi:TLC domain